MQGNLFMKREKKKKEIEVAPTGCLLIPGVGSNIEKTQLIVN